MKLSAIGLGQCGCNITDELYSVNTYARSIFNRNVEILTDAFAINTDEADLGGFRNIPKDNAHRILIGTMTTFGHGVGKINGDAANIMKASNMVVSDTILRSRKFHESDAVMVIASGGGGTGSGIAGLVVKALKERVDKPIYAVIVLPFAFEERGDSSYAVMNAATCINTVTRHADAVLIIDNERYRKAGNSLAECLQEINREIAWSFYDLCCAGEEVKQKYIGGKVLDAGDIKRSLDGITTLGRGEINLPVFRWHRDFHDGIREQASILGALRHAESNSSLSIKLDDARRILALVCAPRNAITVNSLEEISNYLQEKSPKAVIRIGDYPRRGKEVSITLITSQLTHVPRLEHLFVHAEDLFERLKQNAAETTTKIEQMSLLGRNLPVLE